MFALCPWLTSARCRLCLFIIVLCLSEVVWDKRGMGGTHWGVRNKQQQRMTTNVIVCHLVATLHSAMWHLDFVLTSYMARTRELAHLGKLPPMSVHGSWPSFVSQVVAFIVVCGRLSSFVGWLWWQGSHGLWLVLGVMSWLVLAALLGCGSGWLKKGSDVTSCDISVMFKLTREITCTISHDLLAVYSKNPSVLVQSLAQVKFSPKGWSQSCWAQARPTCQLLLWKPPELGRNYRGTMKTSTQPELIRKLVDKLHYYGFAILMLARGCAFRLHLENIETWLGDPLSY